MPSTIYAVYALPQGIPVGDIQLGGIGQPWNAPPDPSCYPVFIASDSEGMFGRECPHCNGYWRGAGHTQVCAYCGQRGERYQFLTQAQRRYIYEYCQLLSAGLRAEADGDYIIDMDAVADAAGKDVDKPKFYYAEESQQNHFKCQACGGANDILGRYGYCSVCGTRNDLAIFEEDMASLRVSIKAGGSYEACVRDAVARFDSFAGQYAQQLVLRLLMTARRKAQLSRKTFHNIRIVAEAFKDAVDIDIVADIGADDLEFVERMFHRRHVYEHKGGEADEKYIADSGDHNVRPKQALRETQESAHRLISIILKMAANLHRGFHEIFPPDQKLIDWHNRMKPAAS